MRAIIDLSVITVIYHFRSQYDSLDRMWRSMSRGKKREKFIRENLYVKSSLLNVRIHKKDTLYGKLLKS